MVMSSCWPAEIPASVTTATETRSMCCSAVMGSCDAGQSDEKNL
ncbi:hypothetical protein SynMITS9220_01888 [Synechococcus sp. MIT S9220]|nr:hypothetical protein SynMITS9220_01888 [Synechococcus sp. MIT S9220]